MRIVVILLLIMLATLMGRSYYELERNDDTRSFMRIGMDDVARRVNNAEHNLRIITAFNNETLLAKAHAFAKFVAADPKLIKEPARLKEICRELAVDEVHVSDKRGILIASIPQSYMGSDMSASEQSRQFLPAITNAAFELVQEPMLKGLSVADKQYDNQLFQYAGVARIDSPGIIQVGVRAERVEEARRIADVGNIAGTTRIGKTGSVEIVPKGGLEDALGTFRTEVDAHGEAKFVLDRDCSKWRITIRDYDRSSWLADSTVLITLGVITALLLVWLILLNAKSRRRMGETLDALRTLTRGSSNKRGFLRRALSSTTTLASALVLLIAVAATWIYSTHESRKMAEQVLLSGAADMRGAIDDCVDVLLFHQGNAICSHYQTPEAMTESAVEEVMRRYGLDELNVVNAQGIVIMGAIADRGFDMGSKPLTAKFNCLLNGEKTYSQPFRGALEDPTLRRKYAGIAFPPPVKGYIQIGFAESRVKDGIDYWFGDVANGWHIADNGFYVIAKEETGEIDSCGLRRVNEAGESVNVFKRGQTLSEIGFDVTKASKDAGEFFRATLYGIDCLCLSEVRCYHRVITAMPISEIYDGILESIAVVVGILLFVFAMFVLFMTRLSDLVASLRQEKLASLAAQRRELAAARTIQMSSLPVVLNRDAHYRIYPEMHTAKEVGGDFYDFYTLPSGRRFILIADVSGKGISAAMFMMKARTIIKACMFEQSTFSAAAADANTRLSENNEAEMFVTCWMAAIDDQTGEVEFVNAGHNPPLLKHADGQVEWIRSKPNPAFAVFAGVKYAAHQLTLKPGESLFLYTDGVTEAQNKAGEFFGEDRLAQTLKSASANAVQDVYHAVEVFADGADQADDITMLAFDYR